MIRNALFITLVAASSLVAQTDSKTSLSFDANYYYGSLLVQHKNVAHLARNQPEGVFLGLNIKTFGEQYWQEAYGYPDWGISLNYQNYKNDVLGENIAVYGHFNFYFFERSLQFRLAQGIGVNTNPFDLDTNFKNNAFGSRVLASTYLMFTYQQPIYRGLTLQAGFSLIHHSNGSFRAPNSGTNMYAATVGFTYNFNEQEPEYITRGTQEEFNEPIHYNLFVRGGINEGDIEGLGQFPFVTLGGFIDKRISYKSTFQLGAEVFFSKFLENEIEYRSISFFNEELAGTDYKRVAVFAGYELRISRIAIPMQLGYYVYWPYEYETRIYERIGAKYYFSEQLYATATVKAHISNAEAIEFGVGIRL